MNLFELVNRDVHLRKVASTHGGEYAGPCPKCGGRDRLRVWPHAETPRFWCRQCGWSGDAIQYLRDHDGLTYQEACARVGHSLDMPSRAKAVSALHAPRLAVPPSTAWQARGRAFYEAAQARLWEPPGARAVAYLHHRGLTDDTIRAGQLGYHGVETWEEPERWGLPPDQKKIWLPAGIVFPWLIGSELWHISIRRIGDTIGIEPRYVVVSGSRNTLFGVDTLKPNAPAMLVEGVLDALSVLQEAGDLLAIVATGSTTGGRLERWIGRLALASMILVAFDADAGGDTAAAWWLKALGTRAKRWRPYWDDANAMLQAGIDIRTWVREGLGGGSRWWHEVARWPSEQHEVWAERAAIMAVDSHLPRAEAEHAAYRALIKRYQPNGAGSTEAMQQITQAHDPNP
jgi:DNA primase